MDVALSATFFYAMAACAIVGIGTYSLFSHTGLVRKILSLNLVSSGLCLLIVALGHGVQGQLSDPVSHALVLTGLVISVAATALFLAIYLRLHAQTGQESLDAPASESHVGN